MRFFEVFGSDRSMLLIVIKNFSNVFYVKGDILVLDVVVCIICSILIYKEVCNVRFFFFLCIKRL